jgi:Tir chaperone protein (CesT) family
MSATTRHQSLFAELGRLLGFDDLTLAEDGTATLGFDELVVHFGAPDDTHITLFTALCDAPAAGETPASLLEAMLEANSFQTGTAGAVIGLDRSQAIFTLSHRIPLDGLTPDHLFSRLELFVDLGENWASRLAAAPDPSGPAWPGTAHEEPGPFPDPGAGFIRI